MRMACDKGVGSALVGFKACFFGNLRRDYHHGYVRRVVGVFEAAYHVGAAGTVAAVTDSLFTTRPSLCPQGKCRARRYSRSCDR